MIKSQFFNAVKLANASLFAVQVDKKGFKLVAETTNSTSAEDEVFVVEMTTAQNEIKLFKSVNAIVDMLREEKIFNINIRIDENEIEREERTKYTEEEKKQIEKAKAEERAKKLKAKFEEAQKQVNMLNQKK